MNSKSAPLAVNRRDEARKLLRQLPSRELTRAYRLAGLILADETEAEDATQDALLKAWRSAGSLRDLADLPAWFDRILINVCRDRLRRRRRIRFVNLDQAGTVAAQGDQFKAVLDRDELSDALGSLDEEGRLVIILHYWADLSAEAIAERVGWPVGTVKSRLNKALRMIRSLLGRFQPEAER